MPYIGAVPDKGNFSDLNGAKLILDADADTHITADTDDQIDIQIAGADDFQFTANTLTVLSGSTLTIASGATIANSGTATGFSSADPTSADGDSLGTASAEWSDLYLADGGVIYFGNDQEITMTHSADAGLILKNNITTDDNGPFNLSLHSGETDIALNDILGKIYFAAPDEATGTDAILTAAAIQARSEGDFSSSNNATSLDFMTGASETAAIKMTLSSAGALDVTGDITGSTLNADGDTAAGDNAAIGYTASEGLILTGQGSTSDITIKNDADANVMTVATGTTVAAFASAPTGIITDQFKVRGSGQTDITGDGTDYTVVFTNSEIYDAGSVFTTSTYTASVAGKVHLAVVCEAGPFASGHTRLLMRIVTSNRTYTLWDCNPYSVTNDGGSGSSSYNRWQGSIIADMDASDSAHITLYVAGGAKVIDIGATDDCQFSGYLIKD